MRRQLFYSGCESLDCTSAGEPTARSDNWAATRWNAVLDALIGAPLRLHRYRHLHAEVIEDALRAYDCGPAREHRP
jgi:hypothetical protein